MTSVTARIGSEGQITLPRELWERLGVSVGDRVRLEVEAGGIKVYLAEPFDFSRFIGIAPLDDDMSAVEWQEDMRGDPEERAALHAGPPHPNITRLGMSFEPGKEGQ
ncbi:MAG: AbrB/MazE/SpoVT family DNA-binding domain-containing protein [Deinococcus sp.]|uniref:AbrB/MazE/SpoVT family DNA-binding domain-containing protein n=1 Tax=Deinococcus sp. TaxID=47478 RepID=UPI0026DA9665|nr:AbrB/MazE/SpoVT family DNA-binding domain-containing protein [Deinococcus sp.]MDO4246417.1 AbrB/MazE/SpoVT family DNA-binding domain-containing protein [Deinococcus sp.]